MNKCEGICSVFGRARRCLSRGNYDHTDKVLESTQTYATLSLRRYSESHKRKMSVPIRWHDYRLPLSSNQRCSSVHISGLTAADLNVASGLYFSKTEMGSMQLHEPLARLYKVWVQGKKSSKHLEELSKTGGHRPARRRLC